MARKTSFDVDFHSITLVTSGREGRKWKLPNEPKPAGSGRDGQIRTADLSLRRRPLYPSELRPRTRSDCSKALVPRGLGPARQTLAGDVFAVMHSSEVDLSDGCVGV